LTYAIPIVLVAVVVLAVVLMLVVLSKRGARGGDKKLPFAEDDNTPLGATDEGSDAERP
jgi:hypothetical protein